MRTVNFTLLAFQQYADWKIENRKNHDRITRLILEMVRDPFTGTGKPEALKYELKGHWSRRIDEEHRLVYQVREEDILIISCKGHYPKAKQ